MKNIAGEDLEAGMELILAGGRSFLVVEVTPHPTDEDVILFAIRRGAGEEVAYSVKRDTPLRVVGAE